MKSALFFWGCTLGCMLNSSCDVNYIADGMLYNRDDINNVKFIIPQDTVVSDDFTRLFVKDVNNNWNTSSLQNFFENDDTIGIFPERGDQIPFILSGLTSPQTTFTFQAEGWGLKTDKSYYAYLPFNRTHNFSDYNNITHIYVNYFGQEVDADMADFSTQRLNMNIQGKKQSYYSYMYSEKGQVMVDGSGNPTGGMFFQMRYLGGFVRLGFAAKAPNWAPDNTPATAKFVLARIVATHPIFHMEGTYALDTVSNNRTTLSQSATAKDIKVTKRGLTNVISVKLDSIQTQYVSNNNRFIVNFACPPVEFSQVIDGQQVKATFYIYDSDCNYYMPINTSTNDINYDVLNGTVISEGNNKNFLTTFKWVGKATPEEMRIEPWDDEEETINSNWNYK